MDESKARIRAFLGKYFRSRELGGDEDIFALGFVNSLLAMQLVDFLEKEFEITVEDEDLDLDNFRTVNSIAGFVERKSAARAGA